MNNQRQICALQSAAAEVVSARAEAFDERQEVAAAVGQGGDMASGSIGYTYTTPVPAWDGITS